MAPANIHPFTPASTMLCMSNGPSKCFGTGFLYFHGSAHYLVTAWHNFSGRSFVDKKPVSPNSWLPSHAQVSIPLEVLLDDGKTAEMMTCKFQVKLYVDDDETQPIWLVDKDNGSRFDIAVLPLASLTNSPLIAAQSDRDELTEIITHLNGTRQHTLMPSLSLGTLVWLLTKHRTLPPP